MFMKGFYSVIRARDQVELDQVETDSATAAVRKMARRHFIDPAELDTITILPPVYLVADGPPPGWDGRPV
jgi:hypothetical protein